jgi:hypothetical protein
MSLRLAGSKQKFHGPSYHAIRFQGDIYQLEGEIEAVEPARALTVQKHSNEGTDPRWAPLDRLNHRHTQNRCTTDNLELTAPT